MRLKPASQAMTDLAVDLGICFAYKRDKEPRGIASAAWRRRIAEQMKADGFQAGAGDVLLWSPSGRKGPRRIAVIGLGQRSADDLIDTVRVGAARAAHEAIERRAKRFAVALPADDDATVRAGAEGLLYGNYRFESHLTDRERKTFRPTSVDLCVSADRKAAVAAGVTGAEAVCLARDLVNEPASLLNPAEFARRAQEVAKAASLKCKVLDDKQLAKLGMGALLAVARGSENPAKVVHLTYTPQGAGKDTPSVLLVGKGVTFDSGGLDLKPAAYMLTMKCDMGGAAAVLGAMSALAERDCPYVVHGLLGLVENMTGGDAFKPGDILNTYSGKTVEVGNTDAEGRLVMCDLLAWGEETLKPDTVIDVATLTGACVVALGERASGLFTRHDDLRDELLAAAGASGEKVWQLPLYDEYLKLLQKGPADLHNIGGRYGGAITAGLFLGEFLSRKTRWAHLDIAGPAFTETDLPEAVVGGTGAGVATLLRWLEGA